MIACYLAAFAAGATLGPALVPSGDTLWTALVADVVATLVVLAFSVLLRNTSMYDPYWSVAPILIALYWARAPAAPDSSALRVTLVLTLLVAWGVRLTWNFGRRWRGLGDEDWRYEDLRASSGRLFPLVNAFGLHLMPTLLVFMALLPVHAVLTGASGPFGWLDVVATCVLAGGILIEGVADNQLRRYLDARPEPGKWLASGLWAWSRHPNYFGEVCVWWGLWLFALAAHPDHLWTIVGPAGITILFLAVSIPLIDKRMQARRVGYAEHMRRVSAMVPLPPKRG
jgi:steroid 5-alpha reductase family enzyme